MPVITESYVPWPQAGFGQGEAKGSKIAEKEKKRGWCIFFPLAPSQLNRTCPGLSPLLDGYTLVQSVLERISLSIGRAEW